MAWNRLRSMGNDRGMTQDQISRHLETQLKNQYQRVRKEGALTFDKVQRYLNHLARVGSETLSRSPMDQKKIESFSEKLEPVLTDIGSKQTITESDIEAHTKEVRKQAEGHLKEMTHPGPSPETKDFSSQIELAESEEPSQQRESSVQPEMVTTPGQNDLADKEIIPIGFEQGAPRITIKEFLKFPLAKKEEGPNQDSWFKDHEKYLELALKKGCISQEDLDESKKAFESSPNIKYSKYFNIFPGNEYEDAILMQVFSQWRNKTLKRFLVED